MPDINGLSCCALAEIDGLGYSGGAENALLAMFQDSPYDDRTSWVSAIILFTGASARKSTQAEYAREFAAYIKKHKLGTVEQHTPTYNPNSGKYVTLYVWLTNIEALKRWWKKRHEYDSCMDDED